MLQQDEPDDYVICTGNTYSIRDFLDYSFKYFTISDWSNLVGIDPEFYRPAEVDYLRGRSDKAQTKLGWKPKYNLEMLIQLMIEEKLNEKLQSDVGYIKCIS